MKILHLADFHVQQDWFDWVASLGARLEFDLIVIAGDLQDAFSVTPMHDQARAISKWMADVQPTPIVVCSGNHFFLHTTFGEIWFCIGGIIFMLMMAVWAIAICWWVLLLAVRCWFVTVPLAVLAGIVWIAG